MIWIAARLAFARTKSYELTKRNDEVESKVGESTSETLIIWIHRGIYRLNLLTVEIDTVPSEFKSIFDQTLLDLVQKL